MLRRLKNQLGRDLCKIVHDYAVPPLRDEYKSMKQKLSDLRHEILRTEKEEETKRIIEERQAAKEIDTHEHYVQILYDWMVRFSKSFQFEENGRFEHHVASMYISLVRSGGEVQFLFSYIYGRSSILRNSEAIIREIPLLLLKEIVEKWDPYH